jgi:hypothetical protein
MGVCSASQALAASQAQTKVNKMPNQRGRAESRGIATEVRSWKERHDGKPAQGLFTPFPSGGGQKGRTPRCEAWPVGPDGVSLLAHGLVDPQRILENCVNRP